MANTIFPDLIYKILEVYLDDIITWGETLEELIENLTKIFSKLREFGIFVNHLYILYTYLLSLIIINTYQI